MFPHRRETFDRFVLESLIVSPGSKLTTHKHERAHLLIVFAGEVFDENADEAHRVGPGELLVRPAGITHTNYVGDDGAHLISVDLAPSLTDSFAPLYGTSWDSARLTFPMLRQLPEQIRYELATPDPISRRLLPPLIEQLLGIGARITGTGGRPEWLRRAVAMLETSYAEHLATEDVARFAGVSLSRLSHGFREHTGRSLGDYLRELRIAAASRALRESDDSIATIAMQCGFADQAHLTRTFRELRGMTPREYRRATAVTSS